MCGPSACKTVVLLIESLLAEFQRKGLISQEDIERIYDEAVRRALDNGDADASGLLRRLGM